MTTAALLVAAGRGERLAGTEPKALVALQGRTLLERALEGLGDAGLTRVVVVHPPGLDDAVAALAPRARRVAGGATRTASVRAGLAALGDEVTTVAVHDAARALTPAAVIARAVAAVGGDVVAAAPALPVRDTLKRVVAHRVVGTVDRRELVAVQTPQVVVREVLERALAGGGEATDDLAPVEQLIADGRVAGRIETVPGSPWGLKITWPEDLAVAEALCRAPA